MTMKKLLFLILMMLLPLAANADAVEIDGIYYNLIPKGNVAEVTSNPNKYTGKIVIPDSVKYYDIIYNVTSIGKYAFFQCKNFTSLTIPNSVTNIGENAFLFCDSPRELYVSNIELLFTERTGLLFCVQHLYVNGVEINELEIPGSFTSIWDYAFEGFKVLKSVSIPHTVTSIGICARDLRFAPFAN